MGVIINIFKLPELRKRVCVHACDAGRVPLRRVRGGAQGSTATVMDSIVRQGVGRPARLPQHVQRRRAQQSERVRTGHYAVHQREHHHAADDGGHSRASRRSAKRGRAGGGRSISIAATGPCSSSVIQGWFMATWLESQNTPGASSWCWIPGFGFKIMTILTLDGRDLLHHVAG